MAFGVYTGYPVPAAFATTGAMVGVGLSLGGDPPSTPTAASRSFGRSSPVSGGLAYLTATILRRDDIPETIGVRCLRQSSAVSSPTSNWALSLAARGEPKFHRRVHCATGRVADGRRCRSVVVLVTLAAAAAWFLLIRRRTNASVEGHPDVPHRPPGRRRLLQRRQSGRVGDRPLENLYGAELGLPSIVLLALGATGILAGAWMRGQTAQATSREYAQLGVRRSIFSRRESRRLRRA